MNLNQAEAISALCKELLKAIPHDRIGLPSRYSSTKWTKDDIKDISLDADGNIQVRWSRYAGCNSWDEDITYEELYNLFEDN